MAKRIEDAALNFYDLIFKASKIEKDRISILNNADFELERLKHYLRLCKDLQLLNIKQYEHTSKEVVEIGRLLGGWIKKTKIV